MFMMLLVNLKLLLVQNNITVIQWLLVIILSSRYKFGNRDGVYPSKTYVMDFFSLKTLTSVESLTYDWKSIQNLLA